MFFGIMQQHQGEFQGGLYFKNFPELPRKEKGQYFKYREFDKTSQMDDIITNLAHEMVQKTIVSTYELQWKSEAYVLLGDELWRITTITANAVNQQAAAVVKCVQKEYTIMIRKVANATGTER